MPRQLIEFLVRQMVDHPDEAQVEATGEKSVMIDIKVAPGDAGRIIGKHGRNIKALRTLARAAAGSNRHVSVDVKA
ncbi:MAG: KH domain-containing protein [Deinococcus sp.]|nr:KH domain-containing protein [Deinococcus sp.]